MGRVLIDENRPRSVGEVFEAHGHDVVYVGVGLPRGAPDYAVLVAAEQEGRIIVTGDRDVEQYIKRAVPTGMRGRFRRLGRITLACDHQTAIGRLRKLMPSIEFEYEQVQQERDRRFIARITAKTWYVGRAVSGGVLGRLRREGRSGPIPRPQISRTVYGT